MIAIPTVDLARKVVDIGNCSGETIDKFAKFKLTPLPASEVEAPLIAECVANIECRVADRALVNKYSLFILEAVRIWTDPTRKERRTLHHNGEEPSPSMAGRSTCKTTWRCGSNSRTEVRRQATTSMTPIMPLSS